MTITRKLELYGNYSTMNGMIIFMVVIDKFVVARHRCIIEVGRPFSHLRGAAKGRGCSFPASILYPAVLNVFNIDESLQVDGQKLRLLRGCTSLHAGFNN